MSYEKVEAVVVPTASLFLLRELCVIDGEKWQKASQYLYVFPGWELWLVNKLAGFQFVADPEPVEQNLCGNLSRLVFKSG
jgi:hypothetical protein